MLEEWYAKLCRKGLVGKSAYQSREAQAFNYEGSAENVERFLDRSKSVGVRESPNGASKRNRSQQAA